ncbi:MAG: spore maturation protein A [Oscillospiraceae bacterium]|nr:spore maturation protein A [Oscillospiraceae bacterium]
MMNKIFSIIIVISIAYGIYSGNFSQLSDSLLNDPSSAVELVIFLTGSMCLWGGLMRIAEKAGITCYMAMLFRPAAKLLFKGLDLNGKAFRYICMNVTANILGLGNAATPLGIEAMKELEKVHISEGGDPLRASDNMVTFTVLNTASLTIIPSTCAAIRAKYGSASPMEIFPAVIITALSALTAALLASQILKRFSKQTGDDK